MNEKQINERNDRSQALNMAQEIILAKVNNTLTAGGPMINDANMHTRVIEVAEAYYNYLNKGKTK